MDHSLYFESKHYFLKKHSLLFLRNPKVGSTSIRFFITKLLDIPVNDIKTLRKIRFPTDYFETQDDYDFIKHRIAFVRNPLSRLVSCYEQKKQYNMMPFYERNNLDPSMSFPEFVEIVCNTPDYLSDRHFRSQFTFMFDNSANLIPNHIGRFSHFSNDFEKITKDILPSSFKISNSNKSKHKPFIEYYTPEMIQKVKLRYATDFKLFEFTNDEHINPVNILELMSRIDDSLKINILNHKSKRLEILHHHLKNNTILKPKSLKQKIKLFFK